MKLLPDNKVPKLGAPGESYRENQLLHQVNYLFSLINLKCLLELHIFQCWRLKTKMSRVSLLDAVGSSGILKWKQKLGVTFNSDKLGGIDFTKFSKLSMCSAGTGRYWLVLVKVYV